jgi:hypothetical protein
VHVCGRLLEVRNEGENIMLGASWGDVRPLQLWSVCDQSAYKTRFSYPLAESLLVT